MKNSNIWSDCENILKYLKLGMLFKKWPLRVSTLQDIIWLLFEQIFYREHLIGLGFEELSSNKSYWSGNSSHLKSDVVSGMGPLRFFCQIDSN